jgi:excinuclease ABC subunit B
LQQVYNAEHGIVPQTIVKELDKLLRVREVETAVSEPSPLYQTDDILVQIDELKDAMKTAATNLEFEKAARLRDQIIALRQQLEPA